MPLTRFVTDAFGVATIGLVAVFIFLGLLCIAYLFYFRSRVRSQGFVQLSYFSGPWIIRITFILFAIWWGCGEIIRLSYLRREGKALNALDLKWQENFCKGYIVSNLGFAEPCLFLTLVFLLRAPLQRMESGILSRKWNGKTVAYVFLYCIPVFILQLVIILIGPRLQKDNLQNLPRYFTSTYVTSVNIALCTYPLLSTILLGLFATVLTVYLFWLGRRILQLVINKGLQKRVYTLIVSVTSFLPLRVLLLGLSVLSKPEDVLFEVLVFLAFLGLLICAGVCIFMLVYCPVADSLALGNIQDLEARRRFIDDHIDTVSLIANQCHTDESLEISPGRNSDTSNKRRSISFRTYGRDGTSSSPYVELSLFSPSHDATETGSASPPLLGWPMRHSAQVDEP
ncbi:uncharacterized protein LOC123214489 [Mangifera indica]|uniref:uncharacterized protein LOC123214489 n=1 Tax=Mangifera indica TaxID=29780 RepID=UPI001CFAD9DE|nr:uncharacterized protein LOC123214489 [Mangifera indica]XP_044490216.1 uncharacterized protein LOC123214489 [Mangifera indica]